MEHNHEFIGPPLVGHAWHSPQHYHTSSQVYNHATNIVQQRDVIDESLRGTYKKE